MKIKRLSFSEFKGGPRVFQTGFWAEVKRANSWEPHFFEVEEGGRRFALLVLVRTFVRGFSLAYVPMGPPLEHIAKDGFVLSLSERLASFLPHSVFALRFDFPFDYGNLLGMASLSEAEAESRYRAFARREDLVPAGVVVQPQGTVANIAASCPAYRKRAVRILRKSQGAAELLVWDNDPAELEAWYRIYLETARRDGFKPRSFVYIHRILCLDGIDGTRSRLLLAKVGGRIQGGIVVVSTSSEMVYLFGAARRGPVNVSYPLQDFALRLARDEGIEVYDFYGIEGTSGRGSGLGSLRTFKLAFGGVPLNRIPAMDKVFKTIPWRIFRVLEAARSKAARLPARARRRAL